MRTETFKNAPILLAALVCLAVPGCTSSKVKPPAGNSNADSPRIIYVPSANGTGNANSNLKVIDENANGNANGNAARKKGELRTSTLAATAAPDDSTFTSAMDSDGNFKEVREFRNHPKLLRVERKLFGREERYTVFLRNGKSFPAPADKMKNLRSLAPANILEAIGQTETSPRPSPPAPSEKKQP